MSDAIFLLQQLGHWQLGKVLVYVTLGAFVLYRIFGD